MHTTVVLFLAGLFVGTRLGIFSLILVQVFAMLAAVIAFLLAGSDAAMTMGMLAVAPAAGFAGGLLVSYLKHFTPSAAATKAESL